MTVSTIGEAYIDRDIGQYLRERRTAVGWSQTQVAELLGVTFQQVQKYERGINRLPANRIPLLAEALGFNPNVLLVKGLGREDKQESVDQALRLLKLFNQLEPEDRQSVIEFAENLSLRET